MRSALSKPRAAVTFPGTTVSARTSNSGEFSASMMAMASSVPGSVSMITFRGAAEVTEPNTTKHKTAKNFQFIRNITFPPFLCFTTSLLPCFVLRSSRHNNQRQADQKTGKHGANQRVRALGRAAKFLPDEDAPEGGDHRRALAESIGNRKARAARGDDVEGHANAPNQPAQDAGEVRPQTALEIVREGNRRADERLLHDEGAQNEIAQEDPHRKDENRRVWAKLSRLRQREVRIHRRGHETIEKAHGYAARQREDQSFGADASGSSRKFAVSHRVQNNRKCHQQHAA